jgi:hypothetical protein
VQVMGNIGVCVSIVAGVVAIITAVRPSRRLLVKLLQIRRAAASRAPGAKAIDNERLTPRHPVERRNMSRTLPEMLSRGSITSARDTWAETTASGYGSLVRERLRRRGLTPADYVRGANSHEP